MSKGCKIFAFANQKGGVGKTTSAVNLAASTGALGKKTLLIDLDPQGNCTSGVGISKRTDLSIYDALINSKVATNAVISTKFPNLDIVPSNIALAGAEIELVDIDKREFRLKKAIEALKDSYDYIFIDCPPSLSLLTINALCAADGVIVPMQCEYFALEGLSQLTMTIAQVKRLYNPTLELSGVIITMFDGKEIKSFSDMYNYLAEHKAGDKVTLTVYRMETDETFEIEITLMADDGATQN